MRTDSRTSTSTVGTSTRTPSNYADLMRQVRDAGLLERRTRPHLIRIGINAAFYVAGWTAFALLGDSWWNLLTAVYLAIVFTWTGFLAHEAGHKQLFRTRRANDLAGVLQGNLAIGLAYGWWVDKHHRHHANPNTEGLDPDIDSSVIAFTEEQGLSRRGARRWLARHQAAAFFPLLLLEAVSLHVQGFVAIIGKGYRQRGREALFFGTHLVAYFVVIFLLLSPLKAVLFVVVHQGLLGLYLGLSFAPNHKGMPILSADDDSDFLRRQVLTSRNVRGGPVTDMMLGGLNYQIEHHLFPSMPRSALRHARPIVQAHCLRIGLPYVETGLVDSYRQALGYLRDVGRIEA